MAKSIEDVATAILSAPAPLLLLDTCALLDIIRFAHPDRDLQSKNLVSAAITISQRAQAQPRGLWTCAAQQVEKEWSEHCDSVAADVTRKHQDLERRLARIGTAAQTIGIPQISLPDLHQLDLASKLRATALGLLRTAEVVSEDADTIPRAWQRVCLAVAPAAKGKQEMKDCVIWEQYVALATRLRKESFTAPIIFASSNVTDYGSPGQHHEVLSQELTAAKITFTTDLAWALAVAEGRTPA
jgi:hypothetical protein